MLMMMRSVVVVSLVMSMTIVVQVNGQTNTTAPACESAFLESCEFAETPDGAVKCCAFFKKQYDTDLSCLCYLFSKSEDSDPEAEVALLETCNINTGGTSPCSDFSSPVPGSPTPPSFVPSPPTIITASPPPSSVVPSPPTVFATPSPPITPTLFNAPSPPAVTNVPTFAGNNGEAPACSFLTGMIGLGVTYALVFF